MSLTRQERDTVLTRSAVDDHWTISTSDPPVQRKLKKIADKCGAEVTWQGPEMFVALPRKCISFRMPYAKKG